MLKLSRYIKDIPLEKEGGLYTLVFVTRTGELVVLKKDLWDFLKEGTLESLDKKIITKLKENEILVEEEDEFRSLIFSNQSSMNNSSSLYTVIQPTAFCSFGCGYCGQEHSPKKMSSEIMESIFSSIKIKLEKNPCYKSLRVGWFGSEPLSGFDIIKKMSKKLHSLCIEKNLDFSAKMVTNGYLLSPNVADTLLNECKVKSFEITLDGIAQYHDKRRHTKGGRPTFDVIYANLCSLAQTSAEITIRCNVDKNNIEGVPLLIQKLAEDGLSARVTLYFAPIHSWGNEAHLNSEEKKIFSEKEVEWLVQMVENGFTKTRFLPKRRKKVCIAVTPDEELFDPLGNVFKCTEVSLTPFYEKEGINIHRTGVLNGSAIEKSNENFFQDFYEPSVIEKFHCPSCVVFPLCGGACPKEWKEGRVPCPSFKFNLEERMLLKFLQMDPKSALGF